MVRDVSTPPHLHPSCARTGCFIGRVCSKCKEAEKWLGSRVGEDGNNLGIRDGNTKSCLGMP